MWRYFVLMCLPLVVAAAEALLPPGAMAALESGWIADISYSPGGRYLALAVGTTVEVRGGGDLGEVAVIPLPGGRWVYSVAFVGPEALAAGCGDGSVVLIDIPSRSPVGIVTPHEGRVWGLAADPAGGYVASAAQDGTVALMALPGLEVVFSRPAHEGGAFSVALSPGGIMASGGADGGVLLWRVPEGEPLRELRGHGGAVWSVAFSPDGTLISGGSDGKAIVWDPGSGRAVGELPSGAKRVWEVSVQAGGDLIALSTSDLEVHLWSRAEGTFIGHLRAHIASLWTAEFSPDGRLLATVSTDGRAIVWSVEELLSLRPRITELHYARKMGRIQYIGVSFFDPNGDIASMIVELLEGDQGTVWIAPLSRFLPTELLIEGYQGRESGFVSFGLRVDEPQRLVLRITLMDKLGLTSEPRTLELEAMG